MPSMAASGMMVEDWTPEKGPIESWIEAAEMLQSATHVCTELLAVGRKEGRAAHTCAKLLLLDLVVG